MKDLVTIGSFANTCLLSFFLFSSSETYLKILIRGKGLSAEEEESMKAYFTNTVKDYVKNNVFSRDNPSQAMKAFADHLDVLYRMHLVTLGISSLVIILDCPTLKSLQLLWSDYRSGHLDELAQRYLATDEIKKRLNVEKICLKTTITEKNYENCRKALMKLPRTRSGECKQDVFNV